MEKFTILPTNIPEVLVIEPKVYSDNRGVFLETYNERDFAQMLGIKNQFVQDNQSESVKNVFRGLHYQLKQPQAKLCRVTEGEIYEVAVDIRLGSPTFGKYVGTVISAENHRMMYVPRGFAHGFLVRSERATMLYSCDDYYLPGDEFGILWNDPDVAISWGITGKPIINERDAAFPMLSDAPKSQLPRFN